MSKELFSRLLSLFPDTVPEENFFTEMIGWLFAKYPHLLISWLETFLQLHGPYESVRVETQLAFEKLEGHQSGSRPDIVVFLNNEEAQDVVMIESKLGAREGEEQLPRYADHLDVFPNVREKYLLYITRFYDPKDIDYIFRFNKISSVKFIPLQWYQLYQFLENQPKNPILDEVKLFMKEKHMAKINRITPGVLMAMNVFPDVYDFFSEVLDGEVSNRFEKSTGKKPVPEGDRWWNVREWRRYLLRASLDRHLSYFCGFVMPDQNGDFPSIQAILEIDARSSDWSQYAQTMKLVIAETALSPIKWVGYNLDQPKQYAGIITKTSFEEILIEKDHISALKHRFIQYFDELERLLKTYPYLQPKQ